MSELLDPIETIRTYQARWEKPVVDLDNFGTAEPERIAEMIDTFCVRELGSRVAGYVFCHASQGSTHAVGLDDGRRVVVKVRALPDEVAGHLSDADRRLTREALVSVQRAQAELARNDFPCPVPLVGPTPLAKGVATVEGFHDEGVRGNGFEPTCRRLLAEGLLRISEILSPIQAELKGLRPFFQPADRRYPIPHSKLFDFEATAEGAEWIDTIADRSRARSIHPGPTVIGHADWRIEHVRFDGGRISATYDWDSILPLPETQVVGITASSYTTDWTSYAPGRVPTVEAVRSFVSDYEAARGQAFTASERSAVFAMAVYTTAYGARCQHSLAPQLARREWPDGSWPHLLSAAEEPLLAD